MSYKGVIIEESLKNDGVLGSVNIIKTKVEPVTEHHQTPWLKQWTLDTVEISENRAEEVAKQLSDSLDNHYWYADFKNDMFHYIIFPGKVFQIDRSKPEQYEQVVKHGLSLGIPDYQLDFLPTIKEWQRPKE